MQCKAVAERLERAQRRNEMRSRRRLGDDRRPGQPVESVVTRTRNENGEQKASRAAIMQMARVDDPVISAHCVCKCRIVGGAARRTNRQPAPRRMRLPLKTARGAQRAD